MIYCLYLLSLNISNTDLNTYYYIFSIEGLGMPGYIVEKLNNSSNVEPECN